MGGSGSRTAGSHNVFLYNTDFAWVKVTEGGGEGERIEWIAKGRSAQFQYKSKGYSRFLIQVISDPNAESPRVLKQVTLYSYRDHSWVVTTGGVRRQKYGDELWVVDHNEDVATWSFENRRKRQAICGKENPRNVLHVEAGLLKEFLQTEVLPVSSTIVRLLIEEDNVANSGSRAVVFPATNLTGNLVGSLAASPQYMLN